MELVQRPYALFPLTNDSGQALAITVIVVEVVVMVVAAGLILLAHRHTNRVDTRSLRSIKG